MTLYPAWQEPGSAEAVPVYLIAAPTDATSTPAAVPRGCRCVFVNPALLGAWVRRHSTGTAQMEIEADRLLAFMLLHEAGHLSAGTAAADFERGELVQLNIEPSLAKAREEAADEYAAGLIRRHSRAQQVSEASLTANWIAIELGKLSWNMQAYRTLDDFGAWAAGKPSVFLDPGYTHPNLAWRVLRSNHLIQQSPETRALLDYFEEAQARAANPQPLYRRAE